VAKSFQSDVSRVDTILATFAQIKDAFPQGIDIAVINSGVSGSNLVGTVTEKDFDYISNTNFKGTFFSAQEASRQLKDGGKLIFISSATTHLSIPGLSIYAASKSAVDQFARYFAVELGARKISVNSIAPAGTDTDMLSPEWHGPSAELSPFKRIGKVDDIANAVAGVIQAPWITGAVIPVTGGAVIY
jgi:NAD(P)-dependent dehydrogenase (short-subunit alcohol dehydrogenase family)